MVALREGGAVRYVATAIAAAGVALALACASQPDASSGEESAAADRLTEVRVETRPDATAVTLRGLVDPVYTASMHTDPNALVLDLSEVEIATADDLVMVYDGLVDHVTVSSYEGAGEGLARVEVSLAREATYEVVPTPDGIQAIVRIASDLASEDAGASAMDADGASIEPATDDPWADPGATPIAEATDDGSQPLDDAEAELPAVIATTLFGVDATETSDGVLVHLQADGTVWAMETFTLTSPDRLVVDLPGLASEQESGKIAIDTARVSSVRIGTHPDKVRVVLDGGAESAGFAERRVTPAPDGLYLAIGSGPELDAALAAAVSESESSAIARASEAPEPVAVASVDDASEAPAMGDSMADEPFEAAAAPAVEPMDASSREDLARVYGIHYDSEKDYERVVILSDRLIQADLLTPDAETLVVSIKNATVADEATGRVPVAAHRPISLISTFQQPDVAVPEVRVVVKRATNLRPTVTRRGSMMFLDFPNTGLVAAPPPAFSPEIDGPRRTAPKQQLASASGGTTAGSAPAASGASLAGGMPEGVDDGAMDGDLAMAALDVMAGQPSGSSQPLAVPAALEPPAASEILEEGGLIDGKRYEGRRISLDFKDVPVADVLRLIAEVSDLNLIAGDEVEGNVTIRLVDVPWDQALDVILLTKGLGFVRVGNVLRIAPADIIKAEEELRLQERRNKETLEDLMVKLQPVNYAAVKDMAELVKRLLTPRGTVNVDERTNTLIIKDIASVIDEATALVRAVDTETPQVLIEAKIVEAALDFSRELGSTWAVGTNEFEDGFTQSGVNRGLGGPDFRFYDQNNVIFGNPITSIPTAVMNMNAFVLNEDFNVNVQIQAAESTGDGKVISSPRVLTLDNREASIQQGVSIPFQTFENGDAKLEFIDAVLSLLVTPHVTSDRSIIMKVEVTRNAPDDSVPTPTGSPAIARAETKTETLVKDGQTLVIGGIYTVNESQRESRVPYLHRLPLLGAAFKSKEVTDQRKELLIFVTPRIVVASELADT